MPGYKATVIGENFEFEFDNEKQYLEFESTVYFEAEDDSKAEAVALHMVREELLSQAILDDNSDQLLLVNDIQQVDVLANMGFEGDFTWCFPDDDFADND